MERPPAAVCGDRWFFQASIRVVWKINKEYIGMFISETCRAEWNHYACSLYFIVSLLINDWPYSLIFSLIPVIANLPFFLIQRYNRLRLMKFSKKYRTIRAQTVKTSVRCVVPQISCWFFRNLCYNNFVVERCRAGLRSTIGNRVSR